MKGRQVGIAAAWRRVPLLVRAWLYGFAIVIAGVVGGLTGLVVIAKWPFLPGLALLAAFIVWAAWQLAASYIERHEEERRG